MKRIRSFLAVLLCTILLIPTVNIAAASGDDLGKTNPTNKYLPVHYPDDSIKYYSAQVMEDNIYLSLDDISVITGYEYDIGDHIAFSKSGEFGLQTAVDIQFDGQVSAMGQHYSIDIQKIDEQYYLPLEEMLYLTHATWCVEDDELQVSPLSHTIFDFMEEYYVDYIITNRVQEQDILVNNESESMQWLRSSFAHFIKNLDGRFFFLSTYFDVWGDLDASNSLDTMFETDYEKLLMLLLTDDEQFLSASGQKYINSTLEDGPFSDLLETGKNIQFLSNMIEDVQDISNAENLTAFFKGLPNSVEGKLVGFHDLSKIKLGDLIETLGLAGDVIDVVSSVTELMNYVQTAQLASTIQQDTISQLSILADTDKMGYNRKIDQIQQAAQSIINRSDTKGNEQQLFGDVLDWMLDNVGSIGADITFAGKAVNAIQAANAISSATFSEYNDALSVAEMAYYARKMIELEYVAQTELGKIVLKLSPNIPENYTLENIGKLRSALMLAIRLNIRSLSLLYSLQTSGSDDPLWIEGSEAQEIQKRIGEGYAMLIALKSTEAMDKRLPLGSFETMFSEETGLTRQEIPSTILVLEDEIKQQSETITIEREDRSIKDDNGDAVFTIYYDKVVLEGSSPAIRIINQQIESACTEFFANQMAMEQQEAAWQAYKTTGAFLHTATADILNQQDILSIRIVTESYFGGMHPFYGVESLNFDLSTGNLLEINDLFTIEGEELRSHLQQECKNYIDQNPDMAWLDAKDKVDMLQLEKYPFYVQNGTVYLLFQQYELGAGAMGYVSIPCPIV